MIWLLLYLIGYCVTGVVTTKVLSRREPVHRCHSMNSSGHEWRSRVDCKYYCKEGCWRWDGKLGQPTTGDALSGAGLALFWPLLVPPYLFWAAASYERKPKGLSQGELDRLDRVLEGKEDA